MTANEKQKHVWWMTGPLKQLFCSTSLLPSGYITCNHKHGQAHILESLGVSFCTNTSESKGTILSARLLAKATWGRALGLWKVLSFWKRIHHNLTVKDVTFDKLMFSIRKNKWRNHKGVSPSTSDTKYSWLALECFWIIAKTFHKHAFNSEASLCLKVMGWNNSLNIYRII